METIMESPLIEDLEEERYLLNLLKYIFWTEPSPDFLESLIRVEKIAEENEIDRAFNYLLDEVKSNSKKVDEYAEDLAIEFARLFIGPQFPPAIPYASFYLSETRTVMTDITINVRKRYLEAGMAVSQLHSIPDDHIGIELEFISFLTERITDLYKKGQHQDASRLFEIRNNFINEHMKQWVPLFVDKIMEHTREDFYRASALLLKSVIM